MASSRYFIEVTEGSCLKLIWDSEVISLNLTEDCACGPGDGGAFVGSAVLYDLPVRTGVGVGTGVVLAGGSCEKTEGCEKKRSKTSRQSDERKLIRAISRGLTWPETIEDYLNAIAA
jgi:hypothetical protein